MNLFQSLNKEFESRIRLGIMSILMVNEWVEFKEMKETLDITDGNLASHIAGLEKNDYIEVKKEFVGKKPKTSYRATKTGRKAFNLHLNALEKLLNRK
jgi:DNA-binding MarR family transcriptional regulator